MSEPGKLACSCGNTARLNETRCGRCIEADNRRWNEASLWDEVEAKAALLPDGSPEAAFADAVIAYLNNARTEGHL